jgi:hypothetical protein
MVGSTDSFRDPDAVPHSLTDACEADTGRIGTIVVVPSADSDASFGVRIAAGVDGASAESCARRCGPSCIEATRRVTYVSHTPLELPVQLRRTCQGVCCSVGQTCLFGECVDDGIDACEAGQDCTPQAESGVLLESELVGGPGDELVHHLDSNCCRALMSGSRSGPLTVGGIELEPVDVPSALVLRLDSSGLAASLACAGSESEALASLTHSGGAWTSLVRSSGPVSCGDETFTPSSDSTSWSSI